MAHGRRFVSPRQAPNMNFFGNWFLRNNGVFPSCALVPEGDLSFLHFCQKIVETIKLLGVDFYFAYPEHQCRILERKFKWFVASWNWRRLWGFGRWHFSVAGSSRFTNRLSWFPNCPPSLARLCCPFLKSRKSASWGEHGLEVKRAVNWRTKMGKLAWLAKKTNLWKLFGVSFLRRHIKWDRAVFQHEAIPTWFCYFVRILKIPSLERFWYSSKFVPGELRCLRLSQKVSQSSESARHCLGTRTDWWVHDAYM